MKVTAEDQQVAWRPRSVKHRVLIKIKSSKIRSSSSLLPPAILGTRLLAGPRNSLGIPDPPAKSKDQSFGFVPGAQEAAFSGSAKELRTFRNCLMGLDPESPKTQELRGVSRSHDEKSLRTRLQHASLAALPLGGARRRLAAWAPP